jgi:fructose/tagatose bisphosphate aldolase
VSDRRVIVYSLAQARAAVTAAAERQVPVILTSAPGMAGFMGPLWFKALVDQAAALHPGIEVTAMLDCADEAGTALAALRCGFKRVRFSGAAEARGRLEDIAGQMRAIVEHGALPDALDLLDCKDPLASCRAFFSPN